MEQVELAQIIERAILDRYSALSLSNKQITILPSAEAAITWVNYGIHPDEFAIQT
jgi:hypothetical protein